MKLCGILTNIANAVVTRNSEFRVGRQLMLRHPFSHFLREKFGFQNHAHVKTCFLHRIPS